MLESNDSYGYVTACGDRAAPPCYFHLSGLGIGHSAWGATAWLGATRAILRRLQQSNKGGGAMGV